MAQISKLIICDKFFLLPILTTTIVLILFATCNLCSSFPMDENIGQNGYDYNDVFAKHFEASEQIVRQNLATKREDQVPDAVAGAGEMYEENGSKSTNGIQYELKTTEATMPTTTTITTTGRSYWTWPTMPTRKTTQPPLVKMADSTSGDPDSNKARFQPFWPIVGLISAVVLVSIACADSQACAIFVLLKPKKDRRPSSSQPNDDHQSLENIGTGTSSAATREPPTPTTSLITPPQGISFSRLQGITVIHTPVRPDVFPELSTSAVSYPRPGPAGQNQPGPQFPDNPPPYPYESPAQNPQFLSPQTREESAPPPSYETLQRLQQLPAAQESACTGSHGYRCFCANCKQVRRPNNANLPNGGFRS